MVAPTLAARARRDPAVLVWSVAGACWVVTFWLALTGGHELAHHDVVLEQSTASWAFRIAAFLAIWLVMIGAMMLPTIVPMARMFAVVSARAPHPRPSRAAFGAAYVAVWAAFAPLALLGDAGVHAAVDSTPWLAERPALVLAATLVLAGAFQFSPLKYACLTACRSPHSVLHRHYRRGPAGAWWLGLRHGLTCLGCCWALMLVMFATGVGSLAWMLGLTAVMVVEKTSRWGARLVAPVGIALLVAGITIAVAAVLPIGG